MNEISPLATEREVLARIYLRFARRGKEITAAQRQWDSSAASYALDTQADADQPNSASVPTDDAKELDHG